MRKYDIIVYLPIGVVCCYMGKNKYGIPGIEPIYKLYNDRICNLPSDGIDTSSDLFPNYKPVLHNKYWGYHGVIKKCKVIETRKSKPTLNHVIEVAKKFNIKNKKKDE